MMISCFYLPGKTYERKEGLNWGISIGRAALLRGDSVVTSLLGIVKSGVISHVSCGR